MDFQETSDSKGIIGIKDRMQEYTVNPQLQQEYITVNEHQEKQKPHRIMDTVPEGSHLDQETRQKLEQFENMMSKFADKAKEKGHDVGLDYFTKYKQKLTDKIIGVGGVFGFAVIASLVIKDLEGITEIDQTTGEEKQISVLYKPDKDEGSELLKIRTMNPNIKLTKEQEEIARLFGKLPDDPRIIGIGKILRKTSLDEVPQAAAVMWGFMNAFGIHSARRMEARAKKSGLDEMYPEAFDLYHQANKKNVKKGVFGGYTAVARGKNEEAQFLADAILLKYMNEDAETWILKQSLENVILRKGAR